MPWQRKQWCFAVIGAEFVCAMEDVLDLYAEPYDPDKPVVCFDEKPVQLVEETRVPRPVAPGRPALQDYEYRRKGTANVFLGVEPLAGRRQVTVTKQRTMLDFAAEMKRLADTQYPEAQRIRVVLDNLNTHKPASLYEAYPPEEARRILRRLEFHYTPKHASWLNMAEVEIGVLNGQCLERRMPDIETLERETAAWATARNTARATIDWRFTVRDARAKLDHLYPPTPSW
jgi:transposase